jgi:beta-phosphoglucomutase-like phosphatase (HAD superfamily)
MVRKHVADDQPRDPIMIGERSPVLAEIIERTCCLLLDFDGPVCNVFAGLPASTVAARLRGLLVESGVALPSHMDDWDDPFEALRLTSGLDAALVAKVEAALQESELAAIRAAEPTAHAREVIWACAQTGRAVAVVSNNAKAVIEAYLTERDLIGSIGAIVGRVSANPRLLKPSPHPILEAIRLMGADSQGCTLVGDNPADIVSAKAAGIRSIGYANKPGKLEKLTAKGADVVITTMEELASTILAVRCET